MVLKEAFREQNTLTKLIEEAGMFLHNYDNIVNVAEVHMRSKANPNATDETIEQKQPTDMDPNVMLDLLATLLKEKQTLTAAIGKAKASAGYDMDGALAMNKARQNALFNLRLLSNVKSTEVIDEARGYLINNEGNQTPYTYDVKRISTINFDRDNVRKLIKKYQKECEEASAIIDLLNVTLEVNYTALFDADVTLDEAYELFVAKEK